MQELVYFYPSGHEKHFENGHPERPERVEVMVQALESAGWWGIYPKINPLVLSDDLIESVHSKEYTEILERACQAGIGLDMDTYTTPTSWKLARESTGGAAAVASAVWNGDYQRGFALTRPPGHHATSKQGMGFCLLNNIAIASQFLITSSAPNNGHAERIAIIDLDLHHGNGTQDIFWKRSDVLYISTHQSPLYPGTGRLEDIGKGDGEGYTANFPLPPGTGDRGFNTVMEELIIPLLDRFKPEVLLVSFGFDPHWRDPLGHLMLSAKGYGSLITKLVKWSDQNCQGKIAIFLEGGYDLEAAKVCAKAVVAALLDQEWEDSVGRAPHPEGNSWQTIVQQALSIWNL